MDESDGDWAGLGCNGRYAGIRIEILVGLMMQSERAARREVAAGYLMQNGERRHGLWVRNVGEVFDTCYMDIDSGIK